MSSSLEPCILVVKRPVLLRGGHAARLARSGRKVAERLIPAAEEHDRTVRAVEAALAGRGIRFTRLTLDGLGRATRRIIARARLVVTVGGDGTVLAASHFVESAALLGVNSAPRDSVGWFCLARRADLEERLDAVASGSLRPVGVARLDVTINGRRVTEPALNDVLVAHDHPAATSRYFVRVRDDVEEQRSSGVWFATAAGSTAAIRSAGGRAVPIRSRRMQYRIREPYRPGGRPYRLEGGFVGPRETIVIESKMSKGWIFIDGARVAYPLSFGGKAEIRIARESLRIFVDPSRWPSTPRR